MMTGGVSLPREDRDCGRFRPDAFDPSRCGARLRPRPAPADASQERELGDDAQVLSEVDSSASSDDVRDAWPYEWSLVRSLSPEWELDTCDTDTQSSATNNPDGPQGSVSPSPETTCAALGDMTRMDSPPLRSVGSPWMDERTGRGRSRTSVSESRGVREQESGYFSRDRRNDGKHPMEGTNKSSYRHYERGHPLPTNYVPEPKATVPYRNVNLGIPSQRRNPETYMQDTWRSESPQRYSYHSNFRRGTESLRNSPTRHSSVSPVRHKRSDHRIRTLSRSETGSHGSSHLPSRGPSQHTSSRSSPSRRRGSFASRTASPSRRMPSHKRTDSFFSQSGSYDAQRGCSRDSKSQSQASNKHSLDSERLYRNLEYISRHASSSQSASRTREVSPSGNGAHRPESRDSRRSPSPGSWRGSSQSVLSIPISSGSPSSGHAADLRGPDAASPPRVATVETEAFTCKDTTIGFDRSRSCVRRGMEALLLPEPERAARAQEEVGMTMEDYIVLADIPTIQVESEEDFPGPRRRDQSPSPCRDQRFRTQNHQPQADFSSCKLELDDRGRGRERGRDRREKKDSENAPLSRRPSTASLPFQSSDKPSGEHKSAKVTERGLPDCPQTKVKRLHLHAAALKGWMSRLDENDKWSEHWFVLSGASLKYYTDPEAEESDHADGEIDLTTCFAVSDWDVENDSGLRIQTKRAVFTLSAVTSGLRRNWVTSLRQAIENNKHQSEGASEKEEPLSRGPSSRQPAAGFTRSDFEPARSEGRHPAAPAEALSLKKQMESVERECAPVAIKADSPCGPGAPRRARLEAMEAAHRKEVLELRERHEREISRLEGQRDEMLEEERRSFAKVLEALRAGHREELQKARSPPGGEPHTEASHPAHMPPVDTCRRHLDALSERFSEKCRQLTLAERSGRRKESDLECKERELRQLWRENQELKAKLAEEISRMRYFITGQRPDALYLGDVASEVETLLRAKENEVQSLKKELSCLQSQVQSLTEEKEAAYERYKEVYVELSDLKGRSRLEMVSLSEHLRLVNAARRESAGGSL
ncbi:TRIO and F-actin-binding protein-like isoform X3 [Syngnathoides biaculeatus]|uniref:TRIO and F-actin-binding protein-like isoform X3 n=1 Tax=Syngnathoides biaculeatus TaxID=300417 RepID=UPI002ADD56A1|nr:TRIO and F-actin-binding protein-like isoform X3 [Syngnathoides biaculeatus]